MDGGLGAGWVGVGVLGARVRPSALFFFFEPERKIKTHERRTLVRGARQTKDDQACGWEEGGTATGVRGRKRTRARGIPPTHPLLTLSPTLSHLLHPPARARPGHLWYTALDRNVYPDDPKSTKAVVTKTALDQLLWAPAFSCVFFFFIHALDGHPAAALEAIRTKLGPMLLANYALWPLAHLVNFRFVPPSQRILYINAVQILWSAYLSHLAARGMAPLR
jgi:hypothetical protein